MNIESLALIFLAFFALALAASKSNRALAKRLRIRPILVSPKPRTTSFRNSDLLLEIPDFAALIGFAVSSGESLENALRIAVARSSGILSREFAVLITNVDHGSVLGIELERLAQDSPSEQIRELSAKLALATMNGNAVSEMISDYVQSSLEELKAHLLDQAGKNETKMMIPLVFVILPITVMFAVYPSLTLIQSSFL